MIFKAYYPLPKFPPISLSGTHCHLKCLHCNATYLAGMQAAQTPEALFALCRTLKQKGSVGILLSGGSDTSGGLLNLSSMLGTIWRVKQHLGLIMNIHPGLLDADTARNLAVDFASLEIPSDQTIRQVFRLNATTADYVTTYRHLKHAGINVVPHINIYQGDEDRLLTDVEAPDTIVVIVFSPTRHTQMYTEKAPTPEMVKHVIIRIRDRFPDAEIALGCMRPRTKNLRTEIELAALEAGVCRMELPARQTLAYLGAQGHTLKHFDACCALPIVYEERALRT